MALKNGAVDTVVPATDTIVESEDSRWVSAIPIRTRMFQGQTPQSFKMRSFLAAYNSLAPDVLAEMTDAVKILCACGIKVALVQGDPHNIKITHDYDIRLCNHILESEAHD
jgi:2-C-methyl-D-erythritol 4-phosphate cytidylyltransferase